MNEQSTLFSRIGHWLRKTTRADGLPLEPGNGESEGLAARPGLLRPWAKRDQAIANVQSGLRNLNDLMFSIRDSLDRSADRQDQLLQHLSHLPQTLASTVESNRMQTETLKAIHQQMEHHQEHQRHLADILQRLSEGSVSERQALEQVRDRIETMQDQDRRMGDALHGVGQAMQAVGRNTQESAEVLRQIRENQTARDSELERILHKQNTRFTTMLSIAIFLSIAALVAVVGMGYLLLTRG